MLDVLRADGAKVVAFDITFDYPDKTAAPARRILAELEERKKRGETIDAEIRSLGAQRWSRNTTRTPNLARR